MSKLLQIEKRSPDEIIVLNRSRQDVGDITDLANSIISVGQLNPILISSENVLIAGERRLRAIQKLKRKTIEVRVVDGVTAEDQILIELLENLHRKDFTWHEDIDLKYKLHCTWKNQAKQNGQDWGYRSTAKRLRCSLGGLSSDLALSEVLKIFPELKEQATKSRAREVYKALGEQAKALQRMNNLSDEEQENLRKLQAGTIDLPNKNTVPDHVIEGTKEAADKVANLEEDKSSLDLNVKVIYISENYKKFIDKIPNGSVGLVELDPPYAIDYNTNYGENNNKLRTSDDWKEKELYDFYYNYLPLIYEKMIDASWVLCWTGKEHFAKTRQIANDIGFFTQEPGVWVKTGGSTNVPKKNLVSNWEMYLLFRKGNAEFNTPSLLSAINVPTVPPSQRIHQWEKPIALYDHFFKALAKPGTIFLSPFAGSGNCLISAAKTRMLPYGCDKSNKYIPQFYSRLQNYLGITAEIGGI